MIFAPPRHGKSELFSRRFPAYVLGRNPDISIIACSYGSDLSSQMNRDVQRIIDSDIYAEVFPYTQLFGKNVRTIADGSYLRNSDIFEICNHKGTYRSAGVGCGITGLGANVLIIDDPIKDSQEANSPTYRNGVWDWYTRVAYTRRQPGAGVLIGLTRWHEDDLAGRLLQAADDGSGSRWKVLRFPAIAEEDEPHRKRGDPLHPERFSLKDLEDSRLVSGSYGWAALYQQQPAPAGGGMFKHAWLPIVEAVPVQADRCRFWDLAASLDGDYTVGAKLAMTDEGLIFVEDVVRGQWTSHERDSIILQTAKLDGKQVEIVIEQEPGSAGVTVTNAMIRMLSGWTVHADRPTGKKAIRAGPFAAQCEAGNVKLLNADWNRELIDELTMFPTGKHDDQVDAVAGSFNKLADGVVRWGFY